MNVNLPATGRDFEAVSFGTPDGRSGWVLRLPGGRPIATPAYADGMLFVGAIEIIKQYVENQKNV